MDFVKSVVTGTVVVVGAALAGVYYLSTSSLSSNIPTWKIEFRKKLDEINREKDVEKKLRFLHMLLEKTFKELYPEYKQTSPNNRITVGTMLKEKGQIHFPKYEERQAINQAIRLRNKWTHEEPNMDIAILRSATVVYYDSILKLLQ